MNEAAWAAVSGLIILIGLVGTILPFLPGPPVSLIGLILYGWVTGFQKVSVTAIAVFSILTALTILFDIFGPAIGAKSYKASIYGIGGAILGAVLGVFLFGPLGIVIGPFLGAFLGEMLFMRSTMEQAMRTAWGAFVGIAVGTMLKAAVVAAMAGYFVVSLLK